MAINHKKGDEYENEFRALTIKDLPKTLMVHFAAACKLRDTSQRDVVVMLIRRWLKEEASKRGSE